MELNRCNTSEDYLALVNGPAFTLRWMLEYHLSRSRRRAVTIAGLCSPCARTVDFVAPFDGAWHAPDGTLVPNWRDFLRCPACTMNGRQRRVAQLLTEWAMDLPCRDHVLGYVMEQVSPLYR